MSSRIDYRKLYKEYYNIEFSNLYEIHHIDRNRENNSIENLILLPKELHSKYHKTFPPIVEYLVIPSEINLSSNLALHEAEYALGIMKEINKWVFLKINHYKNMDLMED